ncbi:MAG: methyltransferase type 12, partial [Desulfobacteraceae bacterium]|nr:methyltransferase type 12 [Desulfobacteraceae bacterium]
MQDDVKSFQDKMVDVLNGGALNLAMGLGYRAGLFDIMDTMNRPCTVDEICGGAGLNRRYVQEWLGVMVCGEIVDLVRSDDGEPRFFLPKTHGDVLARRAGSGNLGVYTQEIPLLTACALETVFQGFQTGD